MSIEDGDLGWEERLLGSLHRLCRTGMYAADDAERLSEAWADAHAAFHEALVGGCRSGTLLAVRRQLYAQSERYRRLSVPLAESVRDIDGEHRELMVAALDRDVFRGVRVLRHHLEETTRILLRAEGGVVRLVA